MDESLTAVSSHLFPCPRVLKIRIEPGQRTEWRQTKSRKTDSGQKIRIPSGQRTDIVSEILEVAVRRRGAGQY